MGIKRFYSRWFRKIGRTDNKLPMPSPAELERRYSELSKKLTDLEKRYNKLIGKAEEYAPRTISLMREGLPLEVFARTALIARDFKVLGTYPFVYHSNSDLKTERSVDVYAVRDSVFTVPESAGRISGTSWPERNHLLVEVKQRRDGVEWIFAQKPSSFGRGSFVGSQVPVANAGYELRPNESGLTNSPNSKDVSNAVSQLNQSYLPFHIDIWAKRSYVAPGLQWRYASVNDKDNIYLILITNAKLKYFTPPLNFGEIEATATSESSLFSEVPWIIFQPDHLPGLEHHQRELVSIASGIEDITNPEDSVPSKMDLLKYLSEMSHEVHIINFDHLDKIVDLIKIPPRVERISLSLSVDGGPAQKIDIPT